MAQRDFGYTKLRDVVNEALQIDTCRNPVANILNKAGIVPLASVSISVALEL